MKSLIIAVLLLIGCTPVQHPTNDEIIAETKKCEAAGMKAETLRNLEGKIVFIQCAPREMSK